MHPRSSNLVLTTAALLALSVAPAAGGPEGGTVTDNVEHLVIAVPFRIDFVRRRPGLIPRPPVVLAYLSGTLRFMLEMQIVLRTGDDGVEGAVLGFRSGESPPPGGGARLVIDPDSPVQAILPGAVDDYILDHDGYIRTGVSFALREGMALGSPVIAIPGLDGISLRLQRGDIRVAGNTVNIGLLLGVGDDPQNRILAIRRRSRVSWKTVTSARSRTRPSSTSSCDPHG
jgi:hypothetical protein